MATKLENKKQKNNCKTRSLLERDRYVVKRNIMTIKITFINFALPDLFSLFMFICLLFILHLIAPHGDQNMKKKSSPSPEEHGRMS